MGHFCRACIKASFNWLAMLLLRLRLRACFCLCYLRWCKRLRSLPAAAIGKCPARQPRAWVGASERALGQGGRRRFRGRQFARPRKESGLKSKDYQRTCEFSRGMVGSASTCQPAAATRRSHTQRETRSPPRTHRLRLPPRAPQHHEGLRGGRSDGETPTILRHDASAIKEPAPCTMLGTPRQTRRRDGSRRGPTLRPPAQPVRGKLLPVGVSPRARLRRAARRAVCQAGCLQGARLRHRRW